MYTGCAFYASLVFNKKCNNLEIHYRTNMAAYAEVSISQVRLRAKKFSTNLKSIGHCLEESETISDFCLRDLVL